MLGRYFGVQFTLSVIRKAVWAIHHLPSGLVCPVHPYPGVMKPLSIGLNWKAYSHLCYVMCVDHIFRLTLKQSPVNIWTKPGGE